MVLCHNDFSHRNLLSTGKDNNIIINSLIEFELCYPADQISVLSRFMLDLISSNNDKLCNEYLSGYLNIIELDDYQDKLYYYTLSLCIEIMIWSYIGAPGYYNTVFRSLNNMISNPDYDIKHFNV